MPKKESAAVTTTRITVIGTIVVAVIGLISAYWQFVLKPSGSLVATIKTEYVGRIIDVNTQQVIAGAKITLDLAGVPPIVYTDSEGVYRFGVVIKSDVSGQIRVDAQGYQVYTRNITISPDIKIIEDIRLVQLGVANAIVATLAPTDVSMNNWSGVPSVRMPTLNEIRQNKLSIWDANQLKLNDMYFPDTLSLKGISQEGTEYLWPIYWCAINQATLSKNIENIGTVFMINGEVVPDKYIFDYYYDTNTGWKCNYRAIVLGDWLKNTQVVLQIKRNIAVDVNDGQHNYVSGSYIYELVVSVK